MTSAAPLDRRSFLASVATVGGSLMLGFAAPARGAAPQPREITAWIVIEPDDIVVIRVAKSEMGQGGFTALPMLVAEELECDWHKVKAEFAAPAENLRRNRAWGDMSTGGSRSIRTSQESLRRAGAMAREMLIGAAAVRWNVPASECRAAMSVITHLPSGRTLSFGEVAEDASTIAPPRDIRLKGPAEWRLIGSPQRRIEIIDKVLGKPIYGIDVRLPDMLHAAVTQSPVFKGKLKSVDASGLAGLEGIHKVVPLDDAVAVVADNWWRAHKGLQLLDVVWDDGEHASITSAQIAQFLRTGLTGEDAGIGRKDGDVVAAFARSRRMIEAEYAVPFLAHATMEPQNATAHVRGDQVEIWAPTQNGEASLAAAAHAAGVPARNVIVHKTMLGGGFGRRGLTQDFISMAVKIAKQVDRPVKVVWAREEDIRHDFYRPVAMARMRAALDTVGMPLAWHVRITGHSLLGAIRRGGVDKHFQEGFLQDMPYGIPNYLADCAIRMTHVPVGFWRCVNHSQNCFFKESFVDEMAHAAGQDPYHYRRKMLRDHPRADRFLAVLDAAAAAARWGEPPPAGVHRGIALHEVHGTYTAAVVEIAVGRELRVLRVLSAIDCGTVVNPLTVDMQVEGATVYALTAALHGEITIGDGRVEQSNFHDYPMLRLAQMPKVTTVIVPGEERWGGVGEPPVAVIAPALCNAIFAATGKRIRSLPISNHDLTSA
jgi:isoquinoline 1-oxidoreductase beta subunit